MDIINPYIHGGEDVAFDGFGNRSRSFDGVDDYVTAPDGSWLPTGAQTWACWIKPDAYSIVTFFNHNVGTGNQRSVNIITYTDGRIYAQLSPDGVTTIDALSNINAYVIGEWIHVAFTFAPSSPTGLKLYINGSLETVSNVSSISSVHNSTADIGIGANGLGQAPFKGNICDCRIYDTDLTANDISDIYNGTNVTTNLVGHWLTDADNLLDAAGTNHGTNYGTKYSYDNPSPPVEFGSASRDFDGVNDYVDLGNNYGSSVFTASAWIKRDTIATQAVGVVGKWKTTNDKSWLIFSGNEHKFIIRQSNDVAIICTDPTSAVINQWYNLVATADGSNLKLYVDGSLVDTQSYDGTISTNSLSTDIGAFRQSDGNFFFDGKIADVRIYDTDLTASQVSDLYAGTDVTANLVGHYLTDNDDVEDKAGTNDGTNFGSVYSYDNPPMDLVPSRQASRSFDGVNDRIDLADQTSTIGTAFSITVWAKLETLDTADGECIVDMADSAVGFTSYIARIFYYGVTGNLEFAVRDAAGNRNVVAVSGFSETGWVHLAFVRNGSAVEGYVNGVSVGTDSSSTIGAHTASHYFTIGALRNAGATQGIYNTSGKICDVRLYDDVLTSSDIANIYNGTTDRTNLVGQWLTNSDDVLDHAGTNDGTNFGSTYSTDSPS